MWALAKAMAQPQADTSERAAQFVGNQASKLIELLDRLLILTMQVI